MDQFRFYSDFIGFAYFRDISEISKHLTKEEFTAGTLSLVVHATVVQYLDVQAIANELYYAYTGDPR